MAVLRARRPFSLCLLIMVATLRGIQGDNCLQIRVTNSPVLAKESSKVPLAFSVSNACGSPISVVKVLVKEETPPHTTVCVFLHADGQCIPSVGCPCSGESGKYNVTGPMDGSEKEMDLVVKLQNGQSYIEVVGIARKQYPPSIESITILHNGNPTNSPIPLNSPVTIVCSWDKGYPPVTSLPRLLNHRGERLAVSHLEGQDEVQYALDHVRCQDMGGIVCETEDGASRLTKNLLVQCPPSFDQSSDNPFSVVVGESLDLRLPVSSYTSVVEDCALEKDTPLGKLTFTSCDSSDRSIRLTGFPPDMTLHLSFTDVTSEVQGSYSLKLTNGAGVGSVNFVIDVVTMEAEITARSPVVEATGPVESDTNATEGLSLGMIVGIVAGFLVLVIGIIVVVGCVRKKRGTRVRRKGRRASGPGAPLPPPPLDMIDKHDSKTSVNGHVYDEILSERNSGTDEDGGYLTPTPYADRKTSASLEKSSPDYTTMTRPSDQQRYSTDPTSTDSNSSGYTTMNRVTRASKRSSKAAGDSPQGGPGLAERVEASDDGPGIYKVPRDVGEMPALVAAVQSGETGGEPPYANAADVPLLE